MRITKNYQDWHDIPKIVVTDLKFSLKYPLWQLALIISKGVIQTTSRVKNSITLPSVATESQHWPQDIPKGTGVFYIYLLVFELHLKLMAYQQPSNWTYGILSRWEFMFDCNIDDYPCLVRQEHQKRT